MINKLIFSTILMSLMGVFLVAQDQPGQISTTLSSNIIERLEGISNRFLSREKIGRVNDIVLLVKNSQEVFESNKTIIQSRQGSTPFYRTTIADLSNFYDRDDSYFTGNFSQIFYYNNYEGVGFGNNVREFESFRFVSSHNSRTFFSRIFDNLSGQNAEVYRYINFNPPSTLEIKVSPIEKNSDRIGYLGIDFSESFGSTDGTPIPAVIDVESSEFNSDVVYTFLVFKFGNLFGSDDGRTISLTSASSFLINQDAAGSNTIIGTMNYRYAPYLIKIEIDSLDIYDRNTISAIQTHIENN